MFDWVLNTSLSRAIISYKSCIKLLEDSCKVTILIIYFYFNRETSKQYAILWKTRKASGLKVSTLHSCRILQCCGLSTLLQGEVYTRARTIDETRQLQLFLYKLFVTFVWSQVMKPGHFSLWPGQTGSRLLKAGFRHSRVNTFHINTSSWDEKRPSLLNFPLTIIIKGAFVCLTFLRSSQPELLEKKILLKFTYLTSQQQTNKVTKSDFFQCGFLKILLTRQQCIQNNPNNLRETDCRKKSAWLFFC